jgi:hypothetical protein
MCYLDASRELAERDGSESNEGAHS